MALTPEDVVNKRFQPTKFREGYDQDEVDDFLDEIVVELRRLNQENDELRRKVSELQSGESGEAAVPAPVSADGTEEPATDSPDAVTKAPAEPTTEVSVDEEKAPSTETAPAAPAVPAAKTEPTVTESAPASKATATQPTTPGAPEAGAAHGATATSAAGVLAMAQKLHDDYVAEGQSKREQIIQEAETEATGLVNDAQEKSRKTLADLEEKKSVLERKVEQLKGFERDYRARLKAYIEGQLRDLQNQGPIQDEAAASR